MKSFCNHLHEATKWKPRPIAIEAERLRKEVIKSLLGDLKTPNLADHKRKELKRKIHYLKSVVFTSRDFEYMTDDAFKSTIKNFLEIVPSEKNNSIVYKQEKRGKEAEKKILENPYTICDLLSDPSPKRFISLIKNGLPDMWTYTEWMKDLIDVKDAFYEWFQLQGGRKSEIVREFQKMVSCKNRAPWAAWSGTAYRGVVRNASVVKEYQFTGEVLMKGGKEWLIAKGTYKSRYGAQSWSNDWNTAEDFAHKEKNNLANALYPVGVIFEIDLKKSESLLSSPVIKKISPYANRKLSKGVSGEREILRVSSATIPVKIYVDVKGIKDTITDRYNSWDNSQESKKEARRYVHNKVVAFIGVKGADAFTKTKAFMSLVKKYSP
jgi:hypothetical protein